MKNVPRLLSKEEIERIGKLNVVLHYKTVRTFNDISWTYGMELATNRDEAYENHVRWYYDTFSKLGQVLK